jgi:hypothetical protein
MSFPKVRNLSAYDRLRFYDQIIEDIKHTAYPADYQTDKQAVLKALEDRKNAIIEGRA